MDCAGFVSEKTNEESFSNSKSKESLVTDFKKFLDESRILFYEKFESKFQNRDSTELEDFERIRTLGTGSFGRVILVQNKHTNLFYAMKALEKVNIVKMNQVEHTLYEKQILQAVNFPFLVYMEYAFKDNGYLYFLMPFVLGGEMFTHLRKVGKFEEDTCRFYAAQVVLALQYLHHLDLVYRDLKPENILIDRTGYIKITDFGFCKLVTGRTWTLCGTPEYLAPEVILNRGYGKSVDYWSLGILIFEMLAGFPPFHSSDPMKLYEKIVAGKFKFAFNMQTDARDLIKNLLQIDLSRRLGNLKAGTEEIKTHKWFAKIEWMNILNQVIEAPFIPKIRSPADTSNFDNYEEEILHIPSTEKFKLEFQEF